MELTASTVAYADRVILPSGREVIFRSSTFFHLHVLPMSESERPRRILLADCDSYFVRCAMLADPEGAGKAELLLVGGRADARGVVTSASYAARKYGVHAGMPMSQAVRLCPAAMIVPVPGEMVQQKHHEVRAVLDEFAPVVEAASVDEFYLDLTGTEA